MVGCLGALLTWSPRYTMGKQQTAPKTMLVSEIGSLTLEFTKLSQLTGDPRYYHSVQKISDAFDQNQNKTKLPGMWPIVIDAEQLTFDGDDSFTLGGMSDSLYEYLPKQYLLLGGRLDQPLKMYERFIKVAEKNLFYRALTPWSKPVIISTDVHIVEGKVNPTYRGQHLTCFTGGMVGLGSRILNRPDDLDVAIQLTEGCVWAYNSTASGIGPEIFGFIPCGHVDDDPSGEHCTWSEDKWFAGVEEQWWSAQDENKESPNADEVRGIIKTQRLPLGMVKVHDKRYILRPEAIESVFIMYRITGDPEWMEKAWTMFTRIESLTRTAVAASALDDVTKAKPIQTDSMESFWLAETLKYFYLIFSDWDLLDLDEWVLNTEAHPFRRI
jgi:Glycosyl hydrolase family 47